MVRIACILLFGCLGALGQAFTLQDTAFLGNAIPKVTSAALSPTNLPNASSISWWKSTDYYTNAGVPTLPDSGPTGYSLTNLDGSYNWPVNGGTLNGLNVLQFVFDQSYINCSAYTSSQPHTLCFVMKLDDNGDNDRYLFDSLVSTNRNAAFETTATDPKSFALYAGGVGSLKLNTNKWCLVECLFSGANSGSWTNGVSTGALADAGAMNCQGIILGGNFNRGGFIGIHFAEAMTYSTTFTTSDRNYLSNYVRVRYGAGNVVP